MTKSQFPESSWEMGRFLGIAWDTGDLFTFKVWTEPGGDWTKGSEMTRNVVRARHESEMPVNKQAPDLSQFKFQKKYKTKKRKRNKEIVYELRDIPDGTNETDNTTNNENSGEEVEVEGLIQPQETDLMTNQGNNISADPGGNEEEINPESRTTPNPNTKQKFPIPAEPTSDTGTPSEEDDQIESIKEVNDHLS